MGDSDMLVDVFSEQVKNLHRSIHDEIADLDTDTLSWVPCEGANSIAVLVTHLIGSEIEAVRTVAGEKSDRVRAREFEPHSVTAGQLVALVERADANLDELAPRIDSARLGADHIRPGALDQRPRSGAFILVHTLSHAREHLGQLLLTKQLAQSSR